MNLIGAWFFLAINLYAPHGDFYRSAGYETLRACEEAAAELPKMRPFFTVVPVGVQMICLPGEALVQLAITHLELPRTEFPR